jgi:hypothetical protein
MNLTNKVRKEISLISKILIEAKDDDLFKPRRLEPREEQENLRKQEIENKKDIRRKELESNPNFDFTLKGSPGQPFDTVHIDFGDGINDDEDSWDQIDFDINNSKSMNDMIAKVEKLVQDLKDLKQRMYINGWKDVGFAIWNG